MKYLVMLVFVFGCAHPVLAGPDPLLHTWAGHAYLLSVGADRFSTALLPEGYVEGDPIAKPFIDHGAAAYMTGLALELGTAWVITKVVGKHHPKIAKALLWGGTAVRGYATAVNLSYQRP